MRIQNPVKHIDVVFCENILWLLAANYFRKMLHLRCVVEFWIRLCLKRNFTVTIFWKQTVSKNTCFGKFSKESYVWIRLIRDA